MESFSKWAFTGGTDGHFLGTGSAKESLNKTIFFRSTEADDCEDVVELYLQKIKGYCLIPSSCKQTTIGYEFIPKHSLTSQTSIAQVKQGKVGLDDRLRGIADHVFLFSTDGVVHADSDDVTVLSADDLFDFVCKHRNLLPARISYWLHFLS